VRGVFISKLMQNIKKQLLKGLNYTLALGIAANFGSLALPEMPSILAEPAFFESVATTSLEAHSATTRALEVTLTGYSSTPDQTDDTPFIAASGKHVYDGMIAANFLPFGTKVQIPEHFGDKIFVVDDRMNRRYSDRVDVWFPDRNSAIKFGIKKSTIIIL